MIVGYMPQQSSEIREYELPVVRVCLWCGVFGFCVCGWFFFLPIYAFESYIAPNFRFLIYKQISTKGSLCNFRSCWRSLWNRAARGISSLVLLSVDKFAAELFSGKMEEFLSFCNNWKDTALSNFLDFSSWLLFSKGNYVKMNFTFLTMN